MYATVHRVRSPQGLSGLNAFLYLHKDLEIPTKFDDHSVAENVAGTPIAQIVAVKPGGNFVDSYLDIVGPDSSLGALTGAALRAPGRVRALEHSSDREFDQQFEIDDFRFRFHTSSRIPGEPASELALMIELLPLLLAKQSAARPKLIVNEFQAEGGFEYSVANESLATIREAGLPFDHRPVRITEDVLAHFERLRGPFREQVESLLVPSPEVAALFDGVDFLNPIDKRTT